MMKRGLILLAFFCVSAGAVLAVSHFSPISIPYYQDFSVIYFTDKGLLNGIPIYAYPAQMEFVKTLTPPGFTFHPFPYPPWYALATIYLGLFPIQVAARVWFFMNLAMISTTVWLLTPGWKGIPRILGMLATILFIPIFGLLMVGQYSAPVLLGGALFAHAIKKKMPFWAAVAILLFTFKPHIGGLLFLAGIFWLLAERTPFSRRVLKVTIVGGLVLVCFGFLADMTWPLTYLQSLARYRSLPGVQTCGLCASLSVMLVRLVTSKPDTVLAAWVSLSLGLAAGILLFWRFRSHLKNVSSLTALAAVLTLLVDPYLLNYDYSLLIVPLFWLIHRERLVLAVYFAPWAALAFGRAGNVILALSGLVTFFLILRQPIDDVPQEA